MNLEVKIEIRSIVKKASSQHGGDETHDFIVFVQGLNNNQIEHFVKQVVFYLPSNSTQVKRKPPYLISGSTHASFRLPIDILLQTSEARNKVSYFYYVYLPDKPVENAVNVKTLTFLNTPKDFRKRLLLGGAEVVKQANSVTVESRVKSEPVEITENQIESQGNEANAESTIVANENSQASESIGDNHNTTEAEENHSRCDETQDVCLASSLQEYSGSRSCLRGEKQPRRRRGRRNSRKDLVQQNVGLQDEVLNQSPNTCVQSKDISEQSGSLLIQGIFSFEELAKENEILRTENETLFDKFNKQEGVISTYVEKLPVLQDDLSTVTTEFNQLKQRAEANDAEISSLKSAIKMLMSDIGEHKNKIDEGKRHMKKLKKSSVLSSSFVSESFPCVTSTPLENEPYTNNSHKVLSKENEVMMDEGSMSPTSFEFSTLSTDSNIMQDASKNRLQSSYDTSENKAASSSFSFFNDNVNTRDTASTVQTVPKEMDVELSDSETVQDSFPKELCKNVLKEPNQQYVEHDLLIIEDKEIRISSHKEKDPVLNSLKTGLCQNVTKETAENCRKEEVQVFSTNQKDTEPTIFSCSDRNPVKVQQKRDPVISNFNHLKNPSLSMKRTIALAFPKDIKRPQKAHQDLKNDKQKIICSVPYDKLLNISDSAKLLKIDEKVSMPFKSTSDTITSRDESSSPIPVQTKNAAAEKDSTLNSVDRNLNLMAEDNRNQSVSSCSSTSAQFEKGAMNKVFKKRTRKAKSAKRLKMDEKVCLPFKSTSDTITSRDEASSPIPVQTKNAAAEKDSALNSVDRNLNLMAEENRNQSVSSCSSTDAQIEKGAMKEVFKKRTSRAKSSNTIASIFKGIDDRQMSQAKINYYVHLLTEFILDPKNSPDISYLIFLVVEHLQRTTKNFLVAFTEDRANCIFLPSSENCIVSTLFEVEKKSKKYSELKLIENILNTIHHLILARKTFPVCGLASLCRVFTEICKRKNNLMKPLTLCIEMLKVKHSSSPYLIASIAGVWKEPFMLPSDQSEETMILLGSISLVVTCKTGITKKNRLCSVELISEYFGFPSLPDIKAALNFLKDKIISNCTQDSHEKSWMTASAFTILAIYQPWEWTKKYLIDDYIIPNLSRFSYQEPKEKAFALFCDLCVECCHQRPDFKYCVLKEYYNKGEGFVKEWSAVSLVKYMILSKQSVCGLQSKWIEDNLEKLVAKDFKELYLRKKMYFNKGLIKVREIFIT